MERKDIAFTGLGRAVSDLSCDDGELSVSHNIILDNGAMRPIWVPDVAFELQEGERLVYVHRTAAYKNYIVTGRERVTNHITVYHRYGTEYPDNYLRLVVVLEYPAASRLDIYLRCLIAGTEQERTVSFPKGTLGKQVLSMGEQDTFLDARYEAQDAYYNYTLSIVDDSNNVSDDAEWNENPPEFVPALTFFTDEDETRRMVMPLDSEDQELKLTSLGNTLIVTSDKGLEYVLYKDGAYHYLGQKPPELDVSWSMKLHRLSSAYDYAKITAEGNSGTTTFDEDVQSDVSMQIAAKVNEVISEAEADNWFTSTFYVCWAYRTYNGLYMASPPVMMPLNGGIGPLLEVLSSNANGIYNPSSEGKLDDFWLYVAGFKGKLEYLIPNHAAVMEKLENWKDIVQGVEIYVTRGTTSYNQDGLAKSIVHGNDTEQCVTYGHYYEYENGYLRKYVSYLSEGYYISGMHQSDEDYQKELLNNGVFYKLKSYELSELQSGRTEIELEENAVKNLTTAPVLSDETDAYLEHDYLYADGAFVYNSRLNLYGVKSEKYNFPIYALTAYTNMAAEDTYAVSTLAEGDTDVEVDENGNPTGSTGSGGVTGDTDDGNVDTEDNPGDSDTDTDNETDSGTTGGGTTDSGGSGGGSTDSGSGDTDVEVPEDPEGGEDTGDSEDSGDSGGSEDETPESTTGYVYHIRFVVYSDGKSVQVTSTDEKVSIYEPPLYLFYPDNNAKEAIIERYNVDTDIWEQAKVVLKSHETLQGCYWFEGFDPPVFKEITADERLTEAGETRIVDNGGKIYTSEVNNPFIFPLSGINTVGTGEIVGVSTVTKALSQGQFGQFPLYVFSTEGVWAMEVGSNGLYTSVKPVSRDVCINGDSITQTDNAVLFVSQKGVMLVDGSEVICLSEAMNGRSFDVSTVDRLSTMMADAGVPNSLQGKQDFLDFVKECRMAYDYANSRVVLYAEEQDFCYVYSLTSGTWATLGTAIENGVTDYPDVYVQTGQEVRNFSVRIDYDATKLIDTLVVTRPIKLGDDDYKTIYELVNRGAMRRSRGAVVLWGSHDGLRYVVLKGVNGNRLYRNSGSGWRYFRIGILGEMAVGETLTCSSVAFRRKYGNRLR